LIFLLQEAHNILSLMEIQVCTHRYVCDCEGAYCNCCLESEHRVDTIVTNEDEISQMSETKYIFTPA
ncbi:MAG: hypothetical protein ABJB85_11405, partial [Nitrososphaerota archaeon]